MDKQTLSNYGWLVIVTLVLAVMLAFATPFGSYVGDAVVSVANGMASTNEDATSEENITQKSVEWSVKSDYGIVYNTYKYYATIEEAIDAVNNDDYSKASSKLKNNKIVVSNPDGEVPVVRILRDTEITEELLLKKDMIIDLNDNNLSSSIANSYIFTIENGSTISFVSQNKGKIECENSCLIVGTANNPNLICKNIEFITTGKFVLSGSTYGVYSIDFYSTGKCELENCDFCTNSYTMGGCAQIGGGEIEISNCTFTGECEYVENQTLYLFSANKVNVSNTKINTTNKQTLTYTKTDTIGNMTGIGLNECNNITIKNINVKNEYIGNTKTYVAVIPVSIMGCKNLKMTNSDVYVNVSSAYQTSAIRCGGYTSGKNNNFENIKTTTDAKNTTFAISTVCSINDAYVRNVKGIINADNTVEYAEGIVSAGNRNANEILTIANNCTYEINGGVYSLGAYSNDNAILKISNSTFNSAISIQTMSPITKIYGNVFVGRNNNFNYTDRMYQGTIDANYVHYTNEQY